MNPNPRNRILLLSAVLVWPLATTGLSAAGTKVTAEAPVPVMDLPLPPQESVESAQRRPVSNLRCWQEGQLLFEETRVQGESMSSSARAWVFSQKLPRHSGELVLIETGTATCLYRNIRDDARNDS